MVTAFMDELSRDILYEMSTFVALSCCVTMLKTCLTPENCQIEFYVQWPVRPTDRDSPKQHKQKTRLTKFMAVSFLAL